ncbi:MAG: FAD-dependent oxidoreductase, partial [Clostridia bacterium]|nr:FAD-dependent oxidoreductase [Clostridia bacterium]
MSGHVNVIGAGLTGCEAAMQIASRGIPVRLFDMKPDKRSPAHSSGKFAELVCSNSLKSTSISNASGILKNEMEILGSVIMEAARKYSVPAGGALAVDRREFAGYITGIIESHEMIETICEEVASIPETGITVIATGPLTSGGLSDCLADMTGSKNLHFFDAAAPIV